MSTHLALSPVSEALYALLLADTALDTLISGRVYDDVPEDPGYPFIWYELAAETDRRGLGTGSLPEIDLRVHIFSLFGGKAQAQAILDRVIAVLKDAPLAVAGWTQCGLVFYDNTVALPNEELNGVKVHELAANCRIYVEA